MIGGAKQEAKYTEAETQAIQMERPEEFDFRNLSDFFKLLLKVDKRINPRLYKPENND